ncbi:MAG: ATPase, partial [Bacteroidaceae bacterium]|nr:ATPase [Bacteroidaceae bacterium]
MTKLIADSGSTKTDWCVCHLGEIKQCISTQGINPFHQSVKEIANIIHEMASQLTCLMDIERIEFFGAGCALPEKKAILTNILQEVFNHHPSSIYVASDLEGAARAVCQGSAGIACILGTGSNSCQFDGEKIVANTPCLGYILGDEGSGAVLGRRLVSDCLKGQLPTHLSEAFLAEYQLDQPIVLERIYRQPLANRFLASLTPFLSKHRHEPSIHTLLTEEFTRFFQRNVMAYDTTLPIHFVGSIAYHFREELTEVAHNLNLRVGKILKAPMEGLI